MLSMEGLPVTFCCVLVCYITHNAKSLNVIFELNGINVTEVSAFANEEVYMPCFTEEKINMRSGKRIPDERRVLWEYYTYLPERNEDGRVFFISKYVEAKPSLYARFKEKIDHTVFTEGGEDDGSRCNFPFTAYDNETDVNTTHYTCTDSGKDDGRCWCSTVPYHHTPYTWGFCPCAAPVPGVTLYAEYGTDPGMPCVFPFHYKGRVFDECTRDFDEKDRCWCATVKEMDDKKNKKFGYCACAGPPNQGEWSEWSVWSKSDCGQVTYRTRICLKPAKMTAQVGIGRHLFCDGTSFEFMLFSCKLYDARKEDLHTMSLQKRTRRASKPRTDNSIIIDSALLEDTGLYSCKITSEHLNTAKIDYVNPRQTISSFLLTVIDKLKMKVVILEGENEVKTPSLYKGYKIEYQWQEWSKCNRCGLWKGEQRKGGFCYTRDVRGGRTLACSSAILTEVQLVVTMELPNYMAYRECHVPCEEKQRWFKALAHVKPPAFVYAVRGIVKVHFGETVQLDCDLNRTKFPAWQFDHPSGKISKMLNMRNNTKKLELDVLGRLTLHDTQKNFEGYFSCYVNRKLERNYRIFVGSDVKEMEDTVSKSPPYIRIAIIVMIFAFIALKVATTKIK